MADLDDIEILTLIAQGPNGQLETEDGNSFLKEIYNLCKIVSTNNKKHTYKRISTIDELILATSDVCRNSPGVLLQVAAHGSAGEVQLKNAWSTHRVDGGSLVGHRAVLAKLQRLRSLTNGRLRGVRLASCYVASGPTRGDGETFLARLARVMGCDVSGATGSVQICNFDKVSGLFAGEMKCYSYGELRCRTIQERVSCSILNKSSAPTPIELSIRDLRSLGHWRWGEAGRGLPLAVEYCRAVEQLCARTASQPDGSCVVEVGFGAQARAPNSEVAYEVVFEVMSNRRARIRGLTGASLPAALTQARWDSTKLLTALRELDVTGRNLARLLC